MFFVYAAVVDPRSSWRACVSMSVAGHGMPANPIGVRLVIKNNPVDGFWANSLVYVGNKKSLLVVFVVVRFCYWFTD